MTSVKTKESWSVENQRQLFRALQDFVNTGEELGDLRSFRARHPHFFPSAFYEVSEYLAKLGHNTFFNWFKHLLRNVWLGGDVSGIRLATILGREVNLDYQGPPGGDFEREVTEYLAINRKFAEQLDVEKRPTFGGQLLPGTIMPEWRTGEMVYQSLTQAQFQYAVWALLGQSWRARVCPIDGKYFIAAKPPDRYCSLGCAAAGKRKRNLHWWRVEGSKQAKAARKRGRA